MNVKEYLNQARMLDQRINAKLDQITRLRALAERITMATGSEPVSHSRNVNALQDQIARIIDEENSLNDEIDALADLKTEIRGALARIPDQTCRLLLEMRYLCGQEWEEIAAILHFHPRTVYKIHNCALAEMEKTMENAISCLN